jgi:predicted nucleic acid-binding protein
MATSLSSCVVDTNIIIDLHRGGVLREFFQLPYTIFAPDVIVAELLEPAGKILLDLGLQSMAFSGAEVMKVVELSRHHPEVSINDLFAMLLAEIQGTMLLTGDKRLRRIAEQEHDLQVHGTLWVLDQLIKRKLIPPSEASTALHKMNQSGSRLPKSESERRIQKWARLP